MQGVIHSHRSVLWTTEEAGPRRTVFVFCNGPKKKGKQFGKQMFLLNSSFAQKCV